MALPNSFISNPEMPPPGGFGEIKIVRGNLVRRGPPPAGRYFSARVWSLVMATINSVGRISNDVIFEKKNVRCVWPSFPSSKPKVMSCFCKTGKPRWSWSMKMRLRLRPWKKTSFTLLSIFDGLRLFPDLGVISTRKFSMVKSGRRARCRVSPVQRFII